MGRFARIHPEAHRLAIVKAVLDDHMGQAQAMRAAAEGRLPDVPAFKVSTATISNWCSKERRAREPSLPELVAEGKTDAMLDSVSVRLTRLLERDIAKLEDNGKRDPKEYEAYMRAAKAIASVRPSRVAPGSNSKPKPRDTEQANTNGGGKEQEGSALVSSLAAAASTSTTAEASENGEGAGSTSESHDQPASTTAGDTQPEPAPALA